MAAPQPDTPHSLEECLEHSPFVSRLARRLVGDSAADDLLQDTWVTTLRHPPQRRPELRSWLATVVRNLARNHATSEHRRKRRERTRPARLVAPAAGDLAERRSARARLRTALDSLSGEQREVLVLRYFDGLPPRAIAQRLGVPVETVRSRQKRGLEVLKRRLDRDFGSREEWNLALIGLVADDRPQPRGPVPVWSASIGACAAGLVVALGCTLAWSLSSGSGPARATAGEARDVQSSNPPLPADDPGNRNAGLRVERQPEGDQGAQSPALGADSEGPEPRLGPTQRGLRLELLDAGGRPAGGRVFLARSAVFYDEIGTADPEGRLELVLQERFVGALGVPGLEECVTVMVRSEDRVRAANRIVPCPTGVWSKSTIVLGARGAVVLSGVLFDPKGAPVPDALVTVGGTGATTHEVGQGQLDLALPDSGVTDVYGRFRLPGLAPGRRRVLLEAPGYPTSWAWEDLSAPRDVVLFLTQGSRLTGRVLDQDGHPVAGARVHAVWGDRALGHSFTPSAETRSARDGTFALTQVGRTELQCWAHHPEDPSRVAHAVLDRRIEGTWEAHLAPSDGVHLIVLDPGGKPAANASLIASTPDGPLKWRRVGETDSAGKATFFDLPAGPISVQVSPQAYASEGTAVVHDLTPRPEPYLVQLTTPKEQVAFQGLILDAAGDPLRDRARLALHDGHGYARRLVEVGGDGRVEGRVEPERFTPTLTSDRFGSFDLASVELRAVHDLGTIRLPEPGTIEVEWRWPADHAYELVQLATKQGRPVRLRLASGRGGPIRARVFPGRFAAEIWSPDDRQVERIVLEVSAGQEGRVLRE